MLAFIAGGILIIGSICWMEYMDYWREDAKDYEKKALCEILEARKRILQIQEELKKNGYTVDDGGVSDSE